MHSKPGTNWLLAYQNYCGLIACRSALLYAHRTVWRKITAPGKYVWVKTYIGKVCPAPQRSQSLAFISTELTEEKEIIAEFKKLLPSINPDFKQCHRNISEDRLSSFLNNTLIKPCTDCLKQTPPESWSKNEKFQSNCPQQYTLTCPFSPSKASVGISVNWHSTDA